ncbi:MAG: hypothetical protein AAF399_25420 [Bacteroidota bacterium]
MNEETKRKLAALRQASQQGPRETISPIQQRTPPKPKAKRGRPSTKEEGVNYVKVTSRIPEDTLLQMKMALLTTHRQFKTQDELIRAAIEAFVSLDEAPE